MDEEMRVVTIYNDIDYDGSIERLKEILKKFNASLKAANEDELQILIGRSQLEDFCNELDLDIDDITEEWDSYVAPEQEQKSKEQTEFAAYVGKIDMSASDFDPVDFLERARQNKHTTEIRLQDEDTVYEIYVDFEDKVYIEFWELDFTKDPEDVECNSHMIYSDEFDENDLAAWKKAEEYLHSYFVKSYEPEERKHVKHHQQTDSFPRPGFSAEAAMLLDEAEEAETLDEINHISYLTSAALQSGDIDKEEYANIMRIIAYKESRINDSCKDGYDYDKSLAKEIKNEILEDANADIPEHIEHEIKKTSIKNDKIHDSNDKSHTVNIKNANMKDVAAICDMFDDAGIKYKLTNDELTVQCGPQQWNTLKSRFKVLRGE